MANRYGRHSKRNEVRDSQITDAAFKGNHKRALDLAKRSISKEAIKDEESYKTPYRGNRDEEYALEKLEEIYGKTDSRGEEKCRIKAAKAYHLMKDLERKGRDGRFEIEDRYNLDLSNLAEAGYKRDGELRVIFEGLMNRRGWQQRGLDSSLAIISLVGSIFFLSSSITGNAISNLTNTTSNWIGAGLFCVGIVCGIFALKKR